MSDNLTATKQYIYAIKSKKYVIYLIEKTRTNNYLFVIFYDWSFSKK